MNTLKNKKIILKATHIETQTSISKEIYNDIKAPEVPEIPETPDNNPDTGVDTSKPEQSIIEEESNNNSSNNTNNDNSNSSSNNENNNLDDSSDEANKEESPKTYDGGIGSYILSGISSIGLLSILNKKKKRRK